MDRSQQLIDSLGLLAHPEGGHYRRIYAADSQVTPTDGRSARQSLSGILFLLRTGDFSRWHRLDSDEVWTWIEGAPLELRSFDERTGNCQEHLLATPGRSICMLGVQAGLWQTARSTGAYTLLSCCVAPAFQFSDFHFLQDHPQAHAALCTQRPDWQGWM